MSQSATIVDPNDLGRGPMVMGVTWTFTAIAIITVSLRIYIRHTVVNRISADDWFMCVALVCHIVSVSFVTVGNYYGLGKHDASLTPTEMMNVSKWMWLANTPGLLVSNTARVSIAILLVRIFGVHAWFKWFVIVVTCACSIMTFIMIPCTYLKSTPVSGNWDPYQPGVKIWNPNIYLDIAYISLGFWTFSDLTFVLFPVIILWRLHMPLGQRVGLIILMSASLFTMGLSILKIVGLMQLAGLEADPAAVNVEYDGTLEILWTTLEQACVIIMGCVPPLQAIMKLKTVQYISSALSSLVLVRRNRRTSKPSTSSYYNKSHYSEGGVRSSGGGGGAYQDLEMQTGKRDSSHIPSFHTLMTTTCEQGSLGSQQNLVDGNAIRQTHDVYVSYSQGRDPEV